MLLPVRPNGSTGWVRRTDVTLSAVGYRLEMPTADNELTLYLGRFYLPYAYGLSGFSEVLADFGGGPGQIGLHGTDDPSSIGRSVSYGCIRLSDEDITLLAGLLPLGTPVVIT